MLNDLIDIIEWLHNGFILIMDVGGECQHIQYGKGVKEGDIMALILFLFLMLAFTEILEEEYKKEWQVKPIEYWYHHADENLGQLKGKKFNTKGLVLKLTQLCYSMTATSLSMPEKTWSKAQMRSTSSSKSLG